MNRQLVLHLLRNHGPLSRRQLAERTGLRSSSLTYITRDLIGRGVVRTQGKLDKPGAGKKQVLLEVDPHLGWVLGVGIEGDSASLVLLDCKGQVIDRDRMALREPFTLLPQLLKTRLDNWVARRGTPPGQLLAVGLGMTGVIDPVCGVVLRSTRFNLQNWKLGEALAEAFGVDVRIDNDSNFAAFAEAKEGNAQDESNFLYLLINSDEKGTEYAVQGLGSSMFINGDVYRGACFGAGEIDTILERDHYGCVSAEQLLVMSSPEGDFSQDLYQLADRISATLVPIVDLLDPSAIIIGGNLSLTNQAMIQNIEEQLNARIVPVPNRHVSIRPSLFMDHGVPMGAAIAALDMALLPSETGAMANQAMGVTS